ncbi:MAG: gluconeogenesis factor YvcK family protein [Candidatus Nealsonbacteria bacterium]|nr:MAG: YvcK family protein [Candidatus Nealsonbacteria bacterium]
MKKNSQKKRIVCLGGGTGNFIVLSGLKKYPVKLSAVVAMTDDGGSSGILRDELGILPPGDIRQCLVALSGEDLTLRKLFNYRFANGTFKGHNFGNLFMVALEKITGSFNKSVEKASKVLNVHGKVIPVTLDKGWLMARLKNNRLLKGEHTISESKILSKCKVKKLFIKPKARANPEAISAIKKADLIVIGPGDLYCSILPVFLVEGISEAIRKARAKKVYNCNLMTERGHTDGFKVEDFVDVIESYLGKGVIDYVTFNTKKPSPYFLKKYSEEGAKLVKFSKKTLKEKGYIGANFINPKIYKKDPADIFLQRTPIRHRPNKIAKVLMSLLK